MSSLTSILDRLEACYGRQAPGFPTDPYQFLIWWQCGYPASESTCAKGWDSLRLQIGIEPKQILSNSREKLAAALQSGGMIPDARAERLQEIADRVQDEFGGDFNAALRVPIPQARKLLKTFPGIADPGADRLLLFGGIAPVAAVPSNCPQVLVRILDGRAVENYGRNYKTAQQFLENELSPDFDVRTRAYLLLHQHGQETCKRKNPRCEKCVVNQSCAFIGKGSR